MIGEMETFEICFSLRDTFGERFAAKSEVKPTDDIGIPMVNQIGDQFSAFLSQAGFYRPFGHIFMRDVTEEEDELLDAYLEEIRSKNKKTIKIAQMVIMPFLPVDFVAANSLDSTKRSKGGFGSTGK